MPRRGHVARGQALPLPFHLGPHRLCRRQRVAPRQQLADQPRLRLRQRHRRPQRLQQADEEQIVLARPRQPPPQGQVVARRRQEARVEEREAELVPGAADDHVGTDRGPVCETHHPALEPLDPGLGHNVAAAEPHEQVLADRRVRGERRVVRAGQAEPPRGPDQRPQEDLRRQALHPPGHERVGQPELVQGPAEQIVRHDPGATPGREVEPRRDPGLAQLAGEVHRAVAHPDHHDPLAAHVHGLARVDVGVRVQHAPGEGAGDRRVGPARVPVVAVGHDQDPVLVDRAGAERHPPAAWRQACRVRDLGAEGDPLAEAEVVDVIVEVPGHECVVREVGVVARHRQVGVGHAVARGVNMQRAVGGGAPVRVAEGPVAADAVGYLEAVEGDPAVGQRLDDGDPARTAADHADSRPGRRRRGGSEAKHGRAGRPRLAPRVDKVLVAVENRRCVAVHGVVVALAGRGLEGAPWRARRGEAPSGPLFAGGLGGGREAAPVREPRSTRACHRGAPL